MSYHTYVTGEFEITPPLEWPEFRESQFAPHNIELSYDPSLTLRVEEEAVETDEGTLLRRKATALVMREIDEYRAYDLLKEVQEAVDAFAGHTFTGRLDCEGEANGDMWRVYVRDGKAVRVEPTITWPDEGATP